MGWRMTNTNNSPRVFEIELEAPLTDEQKSALKEGFVLPRAPNFPFPKTVPPMEITKESDKTFHLKMGAISPTTVTSHLKLPVVSIRKIAQGIVELPEDLKVGEFRELDDSFIEIEMEKDLKEKEAKEEEARLAIIREKEEKAAKLRAQTFQ